MHRLREGDQRFKKIRFSGQKVRENEPLVLKHTVLSDHAWRRVSFRGITPEQIQRVIDFGRQSYDRHAIIYFVGDREVEQDRSLEELKGIHVVCAAEGSTVITVYRDRDYKKERHHSNKKPRNEHMRKRHGK